MIMPPRLTQRVRSLAWKRADGSTSGRPATQHLQQQEQQAQQEVAQLTKLALKQQNQLGDLEQQVRTLQAAVCKLDASAPGCKARP